MTNLDSLLKSRDITLTTKVHLVRAMVFPVVTYRCESCTIKKAEHQRIDAFELWCRRRLLRVPWTARRSNQSILKETVLGVHWKAWCWSWNSQYFGHLKWRADSLEKTLMLGKMRAGGEGEDRGWDSWMASLTQWTWVWVNSGSWRWTGSPGVLRFMGLQSRTWLSDWTDLYDVEGVLMLIAHLYIFFVGIYVQMFYSFLNGLLVLLLLNCKSLIIEI